MDSSRVLLIAYLFPPSGGAPVMRSLSFAKYLPRLGCTVVALSAKNPSYAVHDPSLEKQIPPEVPVYRTFTPELPYRWRDRIWRGVSVNNHAPRSHAASGQASQPAWRRLAGAALRSLATPDPQRGWVPFAARKAAALIRQHRIDTVLVTVPPFSGLEIGVRLKSQFPHVKLISDFRDDWLYTLQGLRLDRDAALFNAAQTLERAAVTASDYVVAATPAWTEGMRRRYPDQPVGKFVYVPNGHDPETTPPLSPPPRRKRLVFTYAGSIQNNPVYSPTPFLDALDGLDDEEAAQIEIRFVGRVAAAAEPLLANRRVTVVATGFVPHQEAIRLLGDSDVLLLILGAAAAGAHSAKLFEYLATRRPILAVGSPGSEAANLLRETGGGREVDGGNPEAIRSSVRSILRAWQAGTPLPFEEHKEGAIAAYTRPALAQRLATLTGLVDGEEPEVRAALSRR